MPGSTPTLEVNGFVGWLRLHRPERHNRLEPQDINVLRCLLNQARSTTGLRTLVLTASGSTFSSGFDLTSSSEMPESGEPPQVLLQRVTDELADFPVPTICALNGHVLGGGVDLALACDFRVGIDGMRLRMPATRLGICFYPSGLQRLVSTVGLQAARRIFLLGLEVGAEELVAVDFLDDLAASPEQLEQVVTDLLDAIGQSDAHATAYTKRALQKAAAIELDRVCDDPSFVESLRSPAFVAASARWRRARATA